MATSMTAGNGEVSIKFLDFIFSISLSILFFPLCHKIANNMPMTIPTNAIMEKVRNNLSDKDSTVSNVVVNDIEVDIRKIEKFKWIE
ncbi:hypothetical protein CP336_28130, partial [Pseudomonas fluorescens]